MVRKITELEKVLIQKSKPPDRTSHFLNKAVKLGLENKYAESIVCLDRVIRINPKLAIAWYYKGTALNALGQFQEAIICLENVHRNWCEAWNQKGIAYANLKKYFEAITCFEKAIKFDTDNQSVYAENKARVIKEQEENNV
ncbi:tetratricopeptide repeat protein [Nitrosopumilus sp.]|nr:tetratricopeptide repeat protein [Nitrosopumilus sp.]